MQKSLSERQVQLKEEMDKRMGLESELHQASVDFEFEKREQGAKISQLQEDKVTQSARFDQLAQENSVYVQEISTLRENK